jgi:hypothetical protein
MRSSARKPPARCRALPRSRDSHSPRDGGGDALTSRVASLRRTYIRACFRVDPEGRRGPDTPALATTNRGYSPERVLHDRRLESLDDTCGRGTESG